MTDDPFAADKKRTAALLRAQYRLAEDGETILQTSTGLHYELPTATFADPAASRGPRRIPLATLKAVLLGALPPATRGAKPKVERGPAGQPMQVRGGPRNRKHRKLPRGVQVEGNRFSAREPSTVKHLGTFATIEAAKERVEAALRDLHGAAYRAAEPSLYETLVASGQRQAAAELISSLRKPAKLRERTPLSPAEIIEALRSRFRESGDYVIDKRTGAVVSISAGQRQRIKISVGGRRRHLALSTIRHVLQRRALHENKPSPPRLPEGVGRKRKGLHSAWVEVGEGVRLLLGRYPTAELAGRVAAAARAHIRRVPFDLPRTGSTAAA